MALACGGPRLGVPAVMLLLLLAAAAAYADSPPAGAADSNKAATPPSSPPNTPSAAEPGSKPAPPEKAKTAEPAPPKNLEALAPGEAIGLLGKKVRDAAGEDMGMVVDVLVDGDGQPRAAVIDFGGFLGVGSRKIAVDWRLLELKQTDAGASVLLTLTRADVQAAPEYKPSSNPAQNVMVVGPPPPSAGTSTPADAPK
ncbi:MAG TPA: PRC-barrel domain-containing protein [Stellaceae bacterium]